MGGSPLLAGDLPGFQEAFQLCRGAEPEVGCGFSFFVADEDADSVFGMGVDGAEGGFVGDVVAEEGCWGIWVGLREDSGYGAAFVRAGAEFYAGFEFEEGEAVVAGEWREDGERFFADLGGFWG